MTLRDTEVEYLAGPLTTTSAFAAYPDAHVAGRPEGIIPTVTMPDNFCCTDNPTQGCAAPDRSDTDGQFHTSQSDGCTDTVCNC